MVNNEEAFIPFPTELGKFNFKLKTCDSEINNCLFHHGSFQVDTH